MEDQRYTKKGYLSNSRRKFLGKLGIGSIILGTGSNVLSSENNLKEKPQFTEFKKWDPYDFGAKGDGKSLDTKAIQTAIDDCHKSGGGKVYLYNGCFISGTIYLKSNVTLEIENGAVLKASSNLDDFPEANSKYPSYTGEMVTNKMLIYAEDAKNINICGRGLINGNGDYWKDGPYGSPSFSIRPRIIHFRACENVRVCDITLYNSASWVESYQSCRNIVIDGITVDSRENKDIEKPRFEDAPGRNCDGLDIIDCQQVRISNCNINSGDDGICMKSFSPDEACQDITITNCVVSSNASGIKIGTETSGAFHDIIVQNCVVYDTRSDALSIMTTDGARIERINISDITVRNIKGTAIFIRLGNRNRRYRKNADINKPYLKDVMIENIMGTAIASDYCCSVNGLVSQKVENISLRNIALQFEGGKGKEDTLVNIPEKENSYPNGKMYGNLPIYGFFIRHAKNITLENVAIRFKQEDQRPALLCDDVEQLEIKRIKAQGTLQTPELIRLVNVRNAIISESQSISSVPVFLSLKGNENSRVILKDNILTNVEEVMGSGKEQQGTVWKEVGTIK